MKSPTALGEQEARKHVSLFAKDLLTEASRVATRNGAEEASALHVQRAATHLYASGANRTAQILNTVGGLIAGAGASAFTSFVMTPSSGAAQLSISVAVTVVGAVMLGIGLTRP